MDEKRIRAGEDALPPEKAEGRRRRRREVPGRTAAPRRGGARRRGGAPGRRTARRGCPAERTRTPGKVGATLALPQRDVEHRESRSVRGKGRGVETAPTTAGSVGLLMKAVVGCFPGDLQLKHGCQRVTATPKRSACCGWALSGTNTRSAACLALRLLRFSILLSFSPPFISTLANRLRI